MTKNEDGGSGDSDFTVDRTLSALSGKWKARILWSLHGAGRPLRFAEIKKALPKITPRMLSRQLRELESLGILSRNVRQVSPPHVEYQLTLSGESLQPILLAMRRWAESDGSAPR